MSTVRVKRNDIGVTFTGTLELTTAANWTGATVRWIIKNRSSYNVYSGAGSFTGDYGTGTISSSTSAAVSYTNVAADLVEAGTYDQEWEVTFSGGSKITFPSGSHNTVIVVSDLG